MLMIKKQIPNKSSAEKKQNDEPVQNNKMLLKLTEMAKYFKRHKTCVLKNGLIDGRITIVDSEEE